MFFCYRVKVKEREADPMTEVESACFHGNQYLVWGYRCYFLSWINSHLSTQTSSIHFMLKQHFYINLVGFLDTENTNFLSRIITTTSQIVTRLKKKCMEINLNI